jgi:hypothetical protein
MDTPYVDLRSSVASKTIAFLALVLSLVGYKIWKLRIQRKVGTIGRIYHRVADV